MMDKPLDIFRLEPDGNLIWIDAVADLAMGKARIECVSAQRKGEYYVFDVRTGIRTAVPVEKQHAASEKGVAA